MTWNTGKLGVIAAILWMALQSLAPCIACASPDDTHSLKVQADKLLKQGQINEAITRYEIVLRRDQSFANAYYNLATAYHVQGNFKKASENLEAFVRLEPNDAEALYNLGCLKLRLGVFEQASRCFRRAGRYPCADEISAKITEALHFMKDLRSQTTETQKLMTYLLSGSAQSFLTT